jgi:hypothetical protein
MNKDALSTILSRLNRSAFEKFVVELFALNDYYESCFPLPEAGEGVYHQEIRDSYGGSLHSVFLLHYSPLELLRQPISGVVGDPVLIQKLKAIKKNYKGRVGYWGMVAPEIKKADKLQSISFVTNLYGVTK